VVATGVALITSEKVKCFTEETQVEFYELDQHQKDLIERYCDSSEPYDKAGAYGIQNNGALLVKKIDGDFSNVVGLPVPRLAREMESVIY
jgi:septum formation protein